MQRNLAFLEPPRSCQRTLAFLEHPRRRGVSQQVDAEARAEALEHPLARMITQVVKAANRRR